MTVACYNLTPAQLQARLDQGYVVITGPHNSEATCLADCGATSPPTVTMSTESICTTATNKFADLDPLEIIGTGFTPSATVVLTDSLGANVPCTATYVSPTQFNLTLTAPPTAVGALYAVVTTVNGSSAAPPGTEIGNVVTCSSSGLSIITYGADTSAFSATIGPVPLEIGLLVVNVSVVGDATRPTTITYNGSPMTLAVDKDLPTTAGYVAQYTHQITVDDASGGIEITTGVFVDFEYQVFNVLGLANNTLDRSASANGSSSTPDTGATSSTTTAVEAILGAFIMKTPGGAWTWAGTPAMTSLGLDETVGSASLTAGSYFASSTGTFQAALSGVTPTEWAGVVGTYK